MKRATRVVSGPLALKVQRLRAARQGAVGLEVLSLEHLASRLAGGFRRPAAAADLDLAIRDALSRGGFSDIQQIVDLPGTLRAVQQTLNTAWRSDVVLSPEAGGRLADLARLDARVRSGLPTGVLVPPDLRAAALARVAHAPALFGTIELSDVVDVDPVWRPLVKALCEVMSVSWLAAGPANRSWFPGRIEDPSASRAATPVAEVCADPHAEAVEALRWARELMAAGVPAAEIGIAALNPAQWDEHMLVLARAAELPVHFTHGVSALESWDGQACAALADVLLRGLSQTRVRRLLDHSSPGRKDLPTDWSLGLKRAAGLFTVAQWATALTVARERRSSGEAAEIVLLPRLMLLAEGPGAADAAADAFLHPEAKKLWDEALRGAPVEALDLALPRLRIPDPRSPGEAVSWGPAWHLAAAPRPHVRLLGLTAKAWPRGVTEDPLLPDHVLPRTALEAVPRPEQDMRVFGAIATGATATFVVSRSRRSAEGAILAPSRLFPTTSIRTLARVRTPPHAFSEADRLLARPEEARQAPELSLARACWTAWWETADHTVHDGRVPPGDPVVAAALAREQSATSARRLLRDPLGFVWRYALKWWPAETYTELLALDRPSFGELIHELLRAAVDGLEPHPGLNRATHTEIEAALRTAGEEILELWPGVRPVPPPLLWRRTVDEAIRLALGGLVLDENLQPGTRSWAEVPFGREDTGGSPWTRRSEVRLGGLSFGGWIDRLDLRGDGAAARVTDYKSGAAPRNMDRLTINGGAELQRVIYAAAVRQGFPDVRQVVSRMVYLRDGPAHHGLSGDRLDDALATTERFIAAAAALVAAGYAPSGPDAEDRFNEMRLALPAELELYRWRKAAARTAAEGELPTFRAYL
ncbi:PD-(D/E)XK nuclease family protein [Brevundimonas sp.]|uniref:PD-(D/E)XK nuclease family protein n=1 Tax=Brevundimonas sp. TaxID=1871086 RepID=UPI001AD4D9C0|nr:PD-(D/E)XK nuclease family protein [Brevundimonas sp.]MBN9466015.1 PD-(D/E)XK nuclease family protein [Brevundimonas sp.]